MQRYTLLALVTILLLLNSCGDRLRIGPSDFITKRFDLIDDTNNNVLFWNKLLDPDDMHCPYISRPCWIPNNPQCGLCPQLDAQDRLPEVCTCPFDPLGPPPVLCSTSLVQGCCACEDADPNSSSVCCRFSTSTCVNDANDLIEDVNGLIDAAKPDKSFVTNLLRARFDVSQDESSLRIVMTWQRPKQICTRCPTCLDLFAPVENMFSIGSGTTVLLQGEIEPAADLAQIVPFVVKGVFTSPRTSFRWGLVMSGEISQNIFRGQLEITDLICNCVDVYTFDFT